MEEKNNRSIYWNIAKGIGISCVVIGHVTSSIWLHNFVYMFHLAVFYFIAIYFYNEKKYIGQPVKYCIRRCKKVYVQYVFFSIFFILLHNFFVKFHFYQPDKIYYTVFDILKNIFRALFLRHTETFGGALWFIPTLMAIHVIFSIIMYISNKISKKCGIEYLKYIVTILSGVVLGYVGVILNLRKIELEYALHTSFIVFPICVLAYFFNKCKLKFKFILNKNKVLYLSIVLCIISGVLLLICVISGMEIELSEEKIINGYMFYIVTIIGLIFVLSLSKIIENIPVVKYVFARVGEYSYWIMAMHFFVLKFVDVIYSYIIGESNPEVIGHFVVSYPKQIFYLYIILGIIVPVLLGYGFNYIKNFIMNKWN